jgi:signal transduction histidine kinase
MLEVRLLHQKLKRLYDHRVVEHAVLQEEIGERTRAEAALNRAQAQLSVHAGELEGLVAERTSELAATNQRLEASVDSIRKAKEEFRALFLESQIMQKKLRQLTRQIITAQEEERREISRELHDGVVQTLVGINVELAALGKAAPIGNRAFKAKIARTQRLVGKSVDAVHQFARELRPAVLDDLGLIPALHAHTKIVAARNKLTIHLTAFAGVETLDNARRTVLYRVVQEALANVVRHAEASVVNICISETLGTVRMELHDNGKSFPVSQTLSSKKNKRLGLLGMRERVEMVGGTLTIESAPGQGTTVRAEVPFRPRGAA